MTVMVLGLSGVGKSATIHSLLGQEPAAGYKETKKVCVRCARGGGGLVMCV